VNEINELTISACVIQRVNQIYCERLSLKSAYAPQLLYKPKQIHKALKKDKKNRKKQNILAKRYNFQLPICRKPCPA